MKSLIQERKQSTSSKVGVSDAAVGKEEGVSLRGRFVLPRFLNLPIKPLGVTGVTGSVREEKAGVVDESSGDPSVTLTGRRLEK